MKRAIISDIHANLEALNAVLLHIRGQGISEIFCLGDIVGYGPNPCECLDLMMAHTSCCILGDHDQGALFDPEDAENAPRRDFLQTRRQLETGAGDRDARWNFLLALPRTHRDGDWLYVHGSPQSPLHGYVFSEDIYNKIKMDKLFGLVGHGCFQGHTHVPGVFTECAEFFSPEDLDYVYRVTDAKFLLNVGSVGQPRDGDHRACYAVQEEREVTFHRVAYDRETTARSFRW